MATKMDTVMEKVNTTRRTYLSPSVRFIATSLEAAFLGSNSLVDFVENDIYEEPFD